MILHNPTRVSAAEIGRNFGEWQSRALIAPVVITHHGRDRLILSSATDHEQAHASSADSSGETLAQERLQRAALLEHIQECFISFDGDFRVMHANHRAALYYSITLDSLRGRSMRDLKPFQADGIAWEYYARMVRMTGEPVTFQVKSGLRQDSTLTIKAFPFDGEVGALFSSTNPQEDAVRCLRQGDALSAALEADPDLSEVRLNSRGGITQVSESFVALSGFPKGQLLTLMIAEVLHPHDRPPVHRAFDAVMRDDSAASVEARLMVRDGAMRKLRLSFSAVPGDVHAASAIALVHDLGPEPA